MDLSVKNKAAKVCFKNAHGNSAGLFALQFWAGIYQNISLRHTYRRCFSFIHSFCLSQQKNPEIPVFIIAAFIINSFKNIPSFFFNVRYNYHVRGTTPNIISVL